MATTLKRNDGQNPVIGDSLPIPCTVSNVPVGTTITKAWITVKAKLSDNDAAAIVQKTITTGFSGTTTLTFTITLSKTDTALFTANKKYFWDLQVMDSGAGIWTPVPDGEVTFQKGVTDASS